MSVKTEMHHACPPSRMGREVQAVQLQPPQIERHKGHGNKTTPYQDMQQDAGNA
jgi:hypothetical protein